METRMKSVYIVDSSYAYEKFFKFLGWEVVFSLSQANLVCFTGGEDVSPYLYGAVEHRYTHYNRSRDVKEMGIYNAAQQLNIPCVGICRGGQFLNVMNGGAMYQHVSSHTRDHLITDVLSLETLLVTSTHHQMMKPAKNALIVATSHMYGTREWYEGKEFHNDVSDLDIEVVWYAKTQSLCFQPHPEFSGSVYQPMKEYFEMLLKRFNIDGDV
jgi:gamma-glutamyl-gamma-aminobutyrate hydrolase PuuD